MNHSYQRPLISLCNVCSCEYEYLGNNRVKPILKEISYAIYPHEVVGIGSTCSDELALLSEIVGNIIPFYQGRCIVGDIGMMQDKRIILPHVFFLNTHTMLFENMSVLEYMMFATVGKDNNETLRQKNLLEDLITYDFSYIALSPISILTKEEKVILSFFVASYSDSTIFILDFSHYEFSMDQIFLIKKICDKIRKNRKCVQVSTLQPKLIGICCDKALYISDGEQRYFGTITTLISRMDKVKYLIKDQKLTELLKMLTQLIPEYEYILEEDTIYVLQHPTIDAKDFPLMLAMNHIIPDSIKVNRGRVQNSFKEMDKK